jgi:hypothetical protein
VQIAGDGFKMTSTSSLVKSLMLRLITFYRNLFICLSILYFCVALGGFVAGISMGIGQSELNGTIVGVIQTLLYVFLWTFILAKLKELLGGNGSHKTMSNLSLLFLLSFGLTFFGAVLDITQTSPAIDWTEVGAPKLDAPPIVIVYQFFQWWLKFIHYWQGVFFPATSGIASVILSGIFYWKSKE